MTSTTFTCPACGMTSHHPEDARYGYCGNCHAFTGERAAVIIDPCGNEEPTSCLYVWIVEHGPGDEAIAAMNGMPMMAAKYATAQKLAPVVRQLARTTGKPMKLVRYDKAGELDRVVNP